ncbi:hypothetical protein SK128_008485 [Halocaridina rubra]|uniref:CST complex subunit STN1 n=1 Tax=Halocaridina rubra TaxID=373956 RepID=A0AAN8WMA2_HALRR
MASNFVPYYQRPHLKFFLGHLEVDEEKNEFYVGSQQVVKADVIGAVVSYVQKGNIKLFDLDDGTGKVSCIQFLQDEQQYENTWKQFMTYRADCTQQCQTGFEQSGKKNKKSSNVSSTLLDILATGPYKPQSLELGDFVNIRGRLQLFKEKPQIVVNQWRRIKDFNEYSFRIFQVDEQNESLGRNIKNLNPVSSQVGSSYISNVEITNPSNLNVLHGRDSANTADSTNMDVCMSLTSETSYSTE